MLEHRPNYDCYVDYYWPKSKWVEENCLIGDLSYTGPEADEHVNDTLIQQVPAYNCVSRKYEGFNNVNQDLNYRTEQRVFKKRPIEVQDRIKRYVTDEWTLLEHVWSYYVHRGTGSGFYAGKPFHGYYHSIVSHFGTLKRVDEMIDLMRRWKGVSKPMFSTIGNQNPRPIKGLNLVQHITTFGYELCKDLTKYLEEGKEPYSMKHITDWCNQRNLDIGLSRWNFCYTQMAADIACYFPDLIDPNTSLYCGNNAVQAIEQMFRKPKGMSKYDFHDAALQDLTERLGTNAAAHEDTLCIYIRFLKNVDRSGRNLKNDSGYFIMDKNDQPIVETIEEKKYEPTALELLVA